MKAGSFTPLTTGEYGRLRKKYPTAFSEEPGDWRANMDVARSLVAEFRSGTRDEEFLVTLVDEAHALINPEHSDGRGQFGFVGALGPQAYQIMRASEVTVFLLDPRQGFREHENTTLDDVRRWAEELGAEEPEIVSLEDCQFRCAGSKEYVDAIDGLLAASGAMPNGGSHGMPITFVDTPAGLDEALRPLVSAGSTCRLVASYAREWKSKDVAMPRSLPPAQMDFHEPYTEGGARRHWSKIWNYAPDMDYTLFVQAPLGSDMAGDPLGEVGCPYVVRNFDFDYVGLLWFSDLVWRGDRWAVNLDHVHETGIKRIKGRATRDPTSQDYADVLDAVKSAYRILLTRAMKGVFVWCEDGETRRFLQQHLGGAG